MNIAEYGNGSILFAAITLTITFVVGTFYMSAQLWRQKQGKEPFPLEVEQMVSAPNTACTPLRQAQGGLVGVAAFSSSLRGLKWVPSKRRYLLPPTRG